MSLMLLIPLVLPIVAAGLVLATGRYPNLRDSISVVAGLIVAATVVMIQQDFQPYSFTLAEPLPGISLAFRLDELGLIFMLVAGLLWPVTTLYAIGYMRGHGEDNQTSFFAWFAVAISCTMAIALSANLFTLFLFYEALTLATWPLVVHARTDEARAGGRTYLSVLLFTSIAFLLFAIIGTWFVAGTLEFTKGGVFPVDVNTTTASLLLVLFVFGIGKAAIMPFHRWLPAAMVAPTPVSALLHAVAVVKAGVFTLLKVCVMIFGEDLLSSLEVTEVLMYVAAASILIASIIAMRQDNLKKRLAYSTVSQLNYVIMGALIATGPAFVGSALQIAMHAFGKITLFFCAGAILVAAHKSNVSELRGLGRTMPLTMVAFFIASLSIIGIPPTGGTWVKWYLLMGALEADAVIPMIVLMISSLLSVGYLLVIPARAFFSGDTSPGPVKEAPWPMLVAISISTAGTVLLFFYSGPFLKLATHGVSP